jgi:hypothetical protein
MTFIVSIHVPKTAGTTVAAVFDRCFRRRVLFDYDDDYTKAAVPDPRIVANRDFISSYFSAIHGHFYARRYLDVFPEADYVATLRHPVDRVISQYLHELNENSADARFHEEIASGRMDVVQFAEQPGIGSLMSEHLIGIDISDVRSLIISENLRVSMAVFSKKVADLSLDHHFGTPFVLPVLNTRNDRPLSRQITHEERQEIYLRTPEDNALYRKAEEILRNDAKTFLNGS